VNLVQESLRLSPNFYANQLPWPLVVMAFSKFEIVGDIRQIEVIASGPSLRVRAFLRKLHGKGRWRKCKGTATVRLSGGKLLEVELHWYEAHGIGRRELKIKCLLDDE
jgi:hypothetical protein